MFTSKSVVAGVLAAGGKAIAVNASVSKAADCEAIAAAEKHSAS